MTSLCLNNRQDDILSILKLYPKGLPVRDILYLLQGKTSLSTLKRDLQEMNEMGLVSNRGKGRSTFWFLTACK